jgi:branched-chain amino acid transport system permease protein
VIQAVISGLLLGGIYGLFAVGFSLVFGVMRIVNFAHGEFVMLAMYIGLAIYNLTGIDPLLSLPLTCAVIAALGALIYLGAFRHFVGRASMQQLLVAIAIAMIQQVGTQLIFGPDTHGMPQSWGSQYLLIGTVFLSYAQVAAFFIAVLCVVVVELVLRMTRWGQDLRAVADDAETAELVGLDAQRINTGAFALSSAIAAVAGSVLITYYPVNPGTGFALMPITLIATVIGGLGSVLGAFLGGIACGVISQVAGATAGPALQEVPLYALLLLFLAFRPPRGILR